MVNGSLFPTMRIQSQNRWAAAGSKDTELGVKMETELERQKFTRGFKLEAIKSGNGSRVGSRRGPGFE
jgi:hypothetical protein